ncbi:efflux RND transporter permease subunit [Edaphobacter aggregans]|uniref:efflux RND transporter permease subunit n=1 Tax=Edaphobacter aggregans TaxID=570835 RepID=UPI0007E8D78A|nr:efflux RND transporter permease subunit [Edaphobacter aggregans]
MALENEQDISNHRNIPRFFVEHPHISWILLAGVLIWGWFGYTSMPQRKDPDIPVRLGVAACPWPGATAQQVEQFITRRIEDVAAENKTIHPGTDADYGIKSISLPGYSFVTIQLDEGITDTKRQFSDINLKLNGLNSQLPQGAGPITFQSDFGDTAALMLTVASPKADDIEIAARANSVESAIRKTRDAKQQNRVGQQITVVVSFPQSISARQVLDTVYLFQEQAQSAGILRESEIIQGSGFTGVDGVSEADDSTIQAFIRRFIAKRLKRSELHPDAWVPAIIRDPRETRTKLANVAGEKYSYAELDNFSDLIGRTLQGAPEVSKVERRGALSQTIYLDYSQDRLAAYGLRPADLSKVLSARNIIAPGGTVETGERRVILTPSGQFDTAGSIGDVAVSATSEGAPVYLRDLVQISRGYQAPAQYLNYYTWRDANGHWQRSRAITLAIYMRDKMQIARLGQSVNSKLSQLRPILPADLILAHTSDQPLQVKENIHLFMRALIEAIILVVLVSLLGFWEWRLALIMALAIPITLAMTFGIVNMLGIDLQQVSIATLIIALGLLVDVPVVSGDGIKRHLAEGFPRSIACWLGPTKLASAIFYATITNIIAYLPFLMLTGNTGEFLKSLPIVMTASLVCALIVAMTFVPFLGYYILRPPAKPEPTIEERRQRGFYGFYNRLVGKAIKHRWAVLGGSLVFLVIGGLFSSRLKTQFFPDDVQYWFYLDIWLPNDTPLSVTNDAAMQAEGIVRQVIENSPDAATKENRGHLLKSLTTFAGGGGPRFWFSVSPEMPQTNYAQIIVEITDKEASPQLARPIQDAMDKEVPGAWVTVRQLQTNPVENPVELLISGQEDVDPKNEVRDIRALRQIAGRAQDIVRQAGGIAVLRDDWFPDDVQQRIQIDPDRANVAGITNADVADASATAMSGAPVGVFKEGDKNIPIVARLRMEERAQLANIKNLYVYSSQTNNRVPLLSIATVGNSLETGRIARREHFRTISILCYPQPGVLASEVLGPLLPKLQQFEKNLPPGYQLRIGGESAKQIEGFTNLKFVLLISLLGIYLALLIQFNNAVKPLLVFAAAPYGAIGALIALSVMHTPFGFMAFLGIASLIGVIVSHVIVLFDFIEEMRAKGEPLEQALPDAGIQRIRPVMITVGATILALFPLALEGGPLWQALCYAQIGGLAVATFITLLLVPVLYSIFVLDLKIIRWETKQPPGRDEARPSPEMGLHTSR